MPLFNEGINSSLKEYINIEKNNNHYNNEIYNELKTMPNYFDYEILYNDFEKFNALFFIISKENFIITPKCMNEIKLELFIEIIEPIVRIFSLDVILLESIYINKGKIKNLNEIEKFHEDILIEVNKKNCIYIFQGFDKFEKYKRFFNFSYLKYENILWNNKQTNFYIFIKNEILLKRKIEKINEIRKNKLKEIKIT